MSILAAKLDRFLTPPRLKVLALLLFLALPLSEGIDLFSGSEYYAVGGSLKAEDFMIFYNAGKLADAGHALDAYNYHTMLASINQQVAAPPPAANTPDFATVWPIYLYSPPSTLGFGLLARLPFWAALAVWLLAGLAAMLLAAWLLRRALPYLQRYPYWLAVLLTLGFWPLNIVFTNGQNSCFTLLVYVCAFYLTQPRGRATSLPSTPAVGWDWLAGLIAAVLALQKPQLLLGIGLLWLLTMRWRALVGLAIGVALASGVTLLFLPIDTFGAWLGNLLAFSRATDAPIPDTDVTMRSLLHALLPFAKGLADLLYYLYFVAALATFALALRRLKRAEINESRRHLWQYTLAALFSVAAASYLLIYDLTLLLLPVFLLFALFDRPADRQRAALKLLTAFLYLGLTVCHFVGLTTGVQLAAMVAFTYVGCVGWLFVRDTSPDRLTLAPQGLTS